MRRILLCKGNGRCVKFCFKKVREMHEALLFKGNRRCVKFCFIKVKGDA